MSALQGVHSRIRAQVTGTVQGVGFRPFVYRLAGEEELGGYVLNDEHGVLLEVEGPGERVERFMRRLVDEVPPLAAIDDVVRESVPPAGEAEFHIAPSARRGVADAFVTADSATCADCLRELLDPADRRYRYPFINCTNCGPRFTIVRGVPYDRPLTTMTGFTMCESCRQEYEDPSDRRFHAQPNACPACGPQVSLQSEAGGEAPAGDPVARAASLLVDGAIVAVKGLGGFHLACDARNPDAVQALRARKHREDKPFALMVGDVAAARSLVEFAEIEVSLLLRPARPIVLARRRPGAPVADAIAPGAPELGCMLAYTPLHHLLLQDVRKLTGREAVLVMTSGNVSDEPIAFRDPDALERLAPIADAFLIHDRPIQTRTDDAVVRVARVGGAPRPTMLRRSRGYVPSRLALPVPARRPLLACGAEQKNTFCVAKGAHAWMSHHIGDLEHYATLCAFEEGIEHFERLFAVTPELVAHDLHPGYQSTAFALAREDVAHVGVQHHHAHLAACLAEHRCSEPAVGLIFDGTGYGTDGTVWGGELLVGDLQSFQRAASLWPVRMPGASAAIRQPWRMTHAWLSEAFDEPPPLPRSLAAQVAPDRWETMAQVARSPDVSPVTTSMGRLFDAVGSLCGLRAEINYEGQAAVELEWRAARASGERRAYVLEMARDDADGRLLLDPRSLLRAALEDLEAGVAVELIAAGFHDAVTTGSAHAAVQVAEQHRLRTVVLSGGVFQNRLLLESLSETLAGAGLRVLCPQLLPVNDGGIAFGQAAIAAAQDAAMG